ncbi:Uncharacterised protein [Salmonella enterica subsp. enterica serovar Typhi]|nr:Uncharacterised protein [Salmonella enterica subsp. enterica serovar Typhi]CGW30734.1 Uncharacterised protein [Salmonella enterica subsp. enterica serovar Typhi]CGX72922.1 Uncharacterised protein [Salmonella enterica subsp. enterica serovar Typhi]CGY17729.1 Uncharacterised protein [Salmonella enterica subsp. enterica serovar Typhi]CQS98858.1 Uncharacterised protein [Salmonella enterica subsp. enterica serovar Typhi]
MWPHILAFTVSGLVATVNLTLREIGVLINESTGAMLNGVSSPTPLFWVRIMVASPLASVIP